MENPFKHLYQEPYAGEQKQTIKIVIREDSQSGELGFVTSDMKINEDLYMASPDPLQIAHDLTEHVNGAHMIGSIDDEFEALGGICFVRGHDRELRRDGVGSAHTFESNLSSDVVRMFGEMSIAECTPYEGEVYETDIDDWIEEVIRLSKKGLKEEYSEEELEEILSDSNFSSIDEYLHAASARMKIGYLKAEAMYNGKDYVANELFWNIADAVGSCVREIEYAGQEFILEIDRDRASMEQYYGMDDEYDDDMDPDEGLSL